MDNREDLARFEISSCSEADTEGLGEALGRILEPGDVVGLVGDLGAGKTAFVRGVARGAGVPSHCPVNSPTFTIMNLYDSPDVGICHLDLYRLSTSDEWEGVGVPELLGGARALLVEWADRFTGSMPSHTLWVTINLAGEEERALLVEAKDPRGADLALSWKAELD